MTLYAVPDLPPDDYTTDNWGQYAACRGLDPDLFFPERGEDTRRAKAVCATCPVVDFCLNYAISAREKQGIWGGRSERERRRIRNGEPPVRHEHGTNAGYQRHQRLGTDPCADCHAARRQYENVRRHRERKAAQ